MRLGESGAFQALDDIRVTKGTVQVDRESGTQFKIEFERRPVAG